MTARPLLPSLAACALIALGPAAHAQTPNLDSGAKGSPGGVATMALAQDLYATGVARKDALTVLAAARLAASVTLKDTAQTKTTEGTALAGQEPPSGPPAIAADMIATAATLAGEDEQLAALIETTKSEIPAPQRTASASQSTLAAGQRDIWKVPFFGGAYAEIAIIGDGGANLDLAVTDDSGAPLCKDVSWTDRAYCDFVPQRNGYFLITVENTGPRANSYALLTN